MTSFGHLWRALRLTLEGSRAFAAAKGAIDRGASLPEVVRAWSAETETQSDDSLDEELEAALTVAVGWLEGAALWCVKAAIRVEAWAPSVANTIDRTSDRIESGAIPIIDAVRRGSEWTRQNTPETVERARDLAVRAGKIAERLRQFREGGQ